MAQPAVPVKDTLSAMLQAEAVPMEVLHARYGSLLELVRRVIGVEGGLRFCPEELGPALLCTWTIESVTSPVTTSRISMKPSMPASTPPVGYHT
jgi:hypothetical protein